MRYPLRVLIVSIAALLTARAASASGLYGALEPADPTMTAVEINDPHCGAQSGIAVLYDTWRINTSASIDLTLSLSSVANRAAFYLYSPTFDPANGAVNCIGAASIGATKRLTFHASAN